MRLTRTHSCDVLVLGSGIAGITAALTAAEAGRSVILACKGKLFSGSSFYPGTWGLGLVGPADESDEADLAATIEAVGCGMADPAMVRAFVVGIHPAIEQVRSMGVKLRRADNGGQKEYIPCFDYKHRDWNGIEFDSAREIFSRRLKELSVTVLPGCEALELVQTDRRVCGAVVAQGGSLCYLGCKALVLATGGYGGLFKYHLCTADVEGVGQSLALDAGCRLVNMEFMQMMPGYISPAYQTIFNEKTFRFTRLRCPDGRPLLNGAAKELLTQRSTHGPFTSRLPSKAVDLALFRAFLEDERGVEATYTEEMRSDPPEFVKTYFDWLRESRGLTMEDPIHIGIFAHAANGGIKTDPNAFTGVPGLFAAGEVTGGMHGADRIGGLSTANGLVFGGKAGRSAAEACAGTPEPPDEYLFHAASSGNVPEVLSTLQEAMFRNAMVIRGEEGLSAALGTVERLSANLSLCPSADVHAIAQTRRLTGRLHTAEAILKAALLRRESRGAHYRADYPEADPAQSSPIIVSQDSGAIRARFTKEDVPCS
ncbi:FAD-binding protein [Intestinimonas sp.]|uniref:FAD-binding protein n=1 Tax=Intestinimonas sp. TaxID=1965293 RepID=UPI003AB0770D